MKRVFIALICMVAWASAFAAPLNPKIVVLPSESWCADNGYLTNGLPDYLKAIDSNATLREVISDVEAALVASDCRVIATADYLANLNAAEKNEAYDAGIRVEVNFSTATMGMLKEMTLSIMGTYIPTGQVVAMSQRTVEGTKTGPMPMLVSSAVSSQMSDFIMRLQIFIESSFVRLPDRIEANPGS